MILKHIKYVNSFAHIPVSTETPALSILMLFEAEAIEPRDNSPYGPSLRAGESYPVASPSYVTCENSFRSFNTGELQDAVFGSPNPSFSIFHERHITQSINVNFWSIINHSKERIFTKGITYAILNIQINFSYHLTSNILFSFKMGLKITFKINT